MKALYSAALLVPLLFACDAPTGTRADAAFDPTILTNGELYRWPSGSVVLVWVSSDNSSTGALSVATDRAMKVWNSVPRFGEVKLERTESIGKANIVIYDRQAANPLAPVGCSYDPRGAGMTWFCVENGVAQPIPTSSGAPTVATVVISMDRGAVESQEAYDAMVAHEFGHALGIGGHSTDRSDLMHGNPVVTAPSLRDRQTLWFVLGKLPEARLR